MYYSRANHTAWRKVGEETLVVDLAGKTLFGLNPLAGWVWQQLDGVRSTAGLASFSADYPELDLRQLETFLQALEAHGLVVAQTSPSSEADADAGTSLEPPPEASDPPAITWREAIQQAAATCAFLPGQNPLCNAAPFS